MRDDAFTRLPSALCTGDCSVLGRGEQGSPTEEQLEVFWVRVCYSSTRSPQGEGLLQREEEQQRPEKQQHLFTASNPVIPVTEQTGCRRFPCSPGWYSLCL